MKLGTTDLLLYVDLMLGLLYYYVTHNRPVRDKKTLDKASMWLNGIMLLGVFFLVVLTNRNGDLAVMYRHFPYIFLGVEVVIYLRYFFARVTQKDSGERIGDFGGGSGLQVRGGKRHRR